MIEPNEEDSVAVVEDKRRRNTAASARFRVKKKQWTVNLERSITDLSGRVEELEREANELRRENGWLKEIVMLKSKRFGGSNPALKVPSPDGTRESGERQESNPSSSGVDREREDERASGVKAQKGKGRDEGR